MMATRRRKTRDHRRGKSVEEISKEALTIIVDDTQIDSFGAIEEDIDMDELNNINHGLRLSIIEQDEIDSVAQLLDEIDVELSPQYPTPPYQPNNIEISPKRHSLRRHRSDSHYRASTPLIIKKYTNFQLDSLVRNKKPELIKADKLPLLTDISNEDERHDMLLKKLSLCEVLCNFRIVHDLSFDDIDSNDDKIGNELQAIENKKNMIKECTKYLTKNKWSSIFILQQIVRTVQTNLFRSIPDAFIITEFQGIDKPSKYHLPSWSHLQLIYELMFQVLMNKEIEKQTLATYLSGQFLNNFVQLFHSLSKAEVDYVKILLHSMYLDFNTIRDEIRISISQYCWDFIYYDNGTPDGINAILDIMYSILEGLDDDKLNDPQKWYIVLCHVLCPLHKGSAFDKFEKTLYRCIQTYIRSKPEHFVVVLNNGLLKFWPNTDVAKQHIFVKEILNILKMVKRATILCDNKFNNIFQCVLQRMNKNLLHDHYKIVDETIESFKEKLVRQCIEFHGGEKGWKQIFKSLIYVTNKHYLYITRKSSIQIMDWLKKYRITKKYHVIFEKLENEYNNNDKWMTIKIEGEGEQSLSDKHRKQKWKQLLILAENAKTKLNEEREEREERKEKEHEIIIDLLDIDSMECKDEEKEEESLSLKPSHSQPMPEPDTLEKPIYSKRASQIENDYGYSQVHIAYKKYREIKNANCRNPTHLVLFAKKTGIKGVTFAATNKYFKSRKAVVASHRNNRNNITPELKSKKSPLIPTAIDTELNQQRNNNYNNIMQYKRKKKPPSISSPIIASIKNEKKIDEELSNEVLNSNLMNNYGMKTAKTAKINKKSSNESGDLPYWSILNIGSPKELEGNTLKMQEIKEDESDNVVTANFYNYGKNTTLKSGNTTPATPGSIKTSPMTPTSTYWSGLNNTNLDLNSLIAKNISLK